MTNRSAIGRLLTRLRPRDPKLVRGRPDVVLVRVPPWLGSANRHPENCEAPLDLGYASALVERDGLNAAIVDLETGLFDVDAPSNQSSRGRGGSRFRRACGS